MSEKGKTLGNKANISNKNSKQSYQPKYYRNAESVIYLIYIILSIKSVIHYIGLCTQPKRWVYNPVSLHPTCAQNKCLISNSEELCLGCNIESGILLKAKTH